MNPAAFSLDDFPLRGAAFEQAFCDFLATEPNTWWLLADTLNLWPINSEKVCEALLGWSKAKPRGKACLSAKSWRFVEAEAARFMNWRRLFAHQMEVRGWPARISDETTVPRGLFCTHLAVQLAPPLRQDALMARQVIDSLWANSSAALPAYRLGLSG
jgi:hypothetical protein